jgi:hypothetical protein
MAHVVKTFTVLSDADDYYRVRVDAAPGGVSIALEERDNNSWGRVSGKGDYPLSKGEAMALGKILLSLAEEMEDLR